MIINNEIIYDVVKENTSVAGRELTGIFVNELQLQFFGFVLSRKLTNQN